MRSPTNSKRDAANAGKSDLLRRLLSDPWRKLAAIVLATLLWAFLDSQITKTTTLHCQLRIVDAVTGYSTEDIADGESVLDVQLATDNFTPGSFRSPNDDVVTEITLSFTGPDYLISTIQPGERFFVRTRPHPGDPFLEFDVKKIQGNREVMRSLQRMSPSRVKLDLATNGSEELPLAPDLVHIDLPEPDDDQDYGAKLEPTEMTFSPSIVTLRGTIANLARMQSVLRKDPLFDLNLRDRRDDFGQSEIRGWLTLRELAKNLNVTCTPESPTVKIPLRPDWEDYPLHVPVLLDCENTPYSEELFEDIPDLKVTLSATGKLANELRARRDTLDAWARDNVRVVATLRKDYRAEAPTNIEGRLFFPENPTLRKGRDYKYTGALLVIVTPRL